MNKEEIERIKDLKDIFNKKLENYELDKKFGQLSIDSVYSLFPIEIKLLLDYINQLEEENIQLKIQLLEKKCSDKDIEYKEKIKLQQKVNQLESILNEMIDWKDRNRKSYIYQDGIGEDWYFEDLDVFVELSSILERGKE